MSEYVILTDGQCDISEEVLKGWDSKRAKLVFRFDGEDRDCDDIEIPAPVFYDRMRKGETAKTSAANVAVLKELYEESLKEGKDILYIAFSSGLSMSYSSATTAADELRPLYPERKIIVIDSLAASAGEGLLVYLAVEKKRSGATIEENAEYIKERIPHICHWFTVEDLKYLKAGGRISATTAFIGSMLGVKPILHVDDEGHLIKVSTVRGRVNSIWALGDKFGELAENKRVFISHGDCENDAKLLKEYIEAKYDADVEIITYIGPIIGVHSGPGTLAIFFEGKHK